MNNTITVIKSTLEGNNSRITEAEDRISEVGSSDGGEARSIRSGWGWCALDEYRCSLQISADPGDCLRQE